MKIKHACRDISRPTLEVVSVFCFLALIFVGLYLYVDYCKYLSSYTATQQSELKSAQDKINSNVENIRKLSVLTSNRIVASIDDVKRIQNILISTYALLPDRDFLKIQKVTYEKLSSPQSLISRFGVAPLKVERLSIDKSQNKGLSIFFSKSSVYSKTWIFDQKDQLDGILEIHVTLPHFKETLKLGPTLSFAPDSAPVLLQKKNFPIYGKLPGSFLGYFFKNITHYTIFFLFVVLTVGFVVFSIAYSRFYLKRNFQEEIKTLKNEVSTWQGESNKANDALLSSQKREETHHITCQSYKQFQENFLRHQQEQLHHVLRSLDIIMRALQNPNVSLSSEEFIDILKSCLNVVEPIVSGYLSASKKRPVKVIKILNSVRSLFTEKLYKSALTMKVDCPESLTYHGDPLIIEFILLNLIGKPLYMAPKNGKVKIKVIEQKEGIHIQVKDNGFSVNQNSKKQIEQAFELFMSDEDFQQYCKENDFYYEHDKDKDGLNKSMIFLPNVTEESLNNNVIPLFNQG